MLELPFNAATRDKGYHCEHCGAFVKTYKRKFNSGMAYCLLLLYKSGIRDWLHVENWLIENGHSRIGDFHKLTFYNFLEKLPEPREDGSARNGYYRITGEGILFAEQKLEAQEYMILFRGKLENFAGKNIDIKTALGRKFSYSELMSA